MSTTAPIGPTPSIVMCWELGGGLGHLIKGALLARLLLERGCSVSFAVRELASAHKLLPEDNYCLVQAPVCDNKLQDWPPPADYAELLLYAGWGQQSGLQGQVRGWRGLFDALQTDLVIADHTPTALLAARTQGIPTALWGHGFGVPTPPWPVFRTWEDVSPARLQQVRQLILSNMNAVLSSFASPAISQPEELFEGTNNFLCTWPELDHYPGRIANDYSGPLWPAGIGEMPDWKNRPHPGAPKIFAYLRPNLPRLPDILRALNSLGAAVLVHLADHAGLTTSLGKLSNICFTERLTNMEEIALQADLVVCSGTDTLHGMAVRGVPTLSLPMNAEQRIGAERLADLGAGRYLIPEVGNDSFQASVTESARQLLENPSYRNATARLKERYAHHDNESSLAAIADKCANLARTYREMTDAADSSL